MGNHGNDPLVRGGASTPRPWLAPSPTPEQAEVPELWDDTGLQRPMSSVLAEGIVAPADIAAAIRADFIQGYRDAGGNPAWELRFIAAFWGPTEECPNGESEGDPLAVSVAGHLGLGQFDPWTWQSVWKLASLPIQPWESSYWQGYATAIWSNVVGPRPPAGWACFQ